MRCRSAPRQTDSEWKMNRFCYRVSLWYFVPIVVAAVPLVVLQLIGQTDLQGIYVPPLLGVNSLPPAVFNYNHRCIFFNLLSRRGQCVVTCTRHHADRRDRVELRRVCMRNVSLLFGPQWTLATQTLRGGLWRLKVIDGERLMLHANIDLQTKEGIVWVVILYHC